MNKRKILGIALSLCVVAILAVGASLAYLTDTQKAENTFTVGNVHIELLESSLHRENAGVANGAKSESQLWSDEDKLGTGKDRSEYQAGDTFYTDEQIKANAANYSCENIKLNPGQYYHKMPYVVNTGKNDAYIRIRVMLPAALDTSILDSSMYTTTAIKNQEFTYAYDNSGSVERGGVKYNVYTFTRIKPLAPNEMTYWNVWGTVHMDADVTNEELLTLLGENGNFKVLVEADAIQADGFADATAAFNAFDAKKA